MGTLLALALPLLLATPSPQTGAHGLAEVDALIEIWMEEALPGWREPLGPAPSLEEVLAPLPADFVPVRERVPSPETATELERVAAERKATPEEDLEGRLALAREELRLLDAELGPGHPDTYEASDRVRELGTRRDLDADQRARLTDIRREYHEAVAAYRAGRHAEAISVLVAGLAEERELIGAESVTHWVLAQLTVMLYAGGHYHRAERVGDVALAMAVQRFGRMHPAVTTSLGNFGFVNIVLGRLDVAEELLAHSLACRRELYGDQGAEVALTLMQLVDLLFLRDDLERASSVCDRGIEILRERDERPEWLGILLMHRGILDWSRGDEARAHEHLLESVDLLREAHGGDNTELALALGNLSDVELGLGAHERSLELAGESFAMLLRLHGETHPTIGIAHRRRAAGFEYAGELNRAELEYRAAIRAAHQNGAAGPFDEARATQALSNLLVRRGDLEEALVWRERASERWRVALGRSRFVAKSLRDGAGLQAALGNTREAIAAQTESLELYAELVGADHPRTLLVRLDLARMLLAAGDVERARELVDAVLDLELEPGDGRDRREAFDRAHLLSARLRFQEGAHDAALREVNACLEGVEARVQSPHLQWSQALALAGAIHEARGELDRAEDRVAAALDQSLGLRTRVAGDERDRALYAETLTLAELSRRLVRLRILNGDPRGALEAAELGRERALLDLVHRAPLDLVELAQSREDLDPGELGALVEAEAAARRGLLDAEIDWSRLAQGTRVDEARAAAGEEGVLEARRAWRLAQGELEAGLEAVWPAARPLDAEAVIAAMREDELLLHYGLDGDGACLVAVFGGAEPEVLGYVLTRDAEEVTELRERVLLACASLRAGGVLDPGLLAEVAQSLIPAELWPRLLERERLVLVPDGFLHELPFELLPTPRGSWLEHGPRLVRSSSATLFARGRARGTLSRPSPPRAVVLGDARFGEEPVEVLATAAGTRSGAAASFTRARLFAGGLAPLPGSGVEARQVARRLERRGWGVELLLAEEAGEARLREAVRGAGLLHLATHGLAPSAASPYDAALALSTPERWSPGDDGFLTLEDLVRDWGGLLAACDLVVLSACDTQVGVPLGESRVALSWGFAFGGADSVLVSLWKVDDRATALLMDRFYANYCGDFDAPRQLRERRFEAGRPMPEDAALHEAKLWLARSDPAANRARLEELGYAAEGSASRDFPRPGADPSSRPTEASFDFRAPQFGSAFALHGQPD